MLRRSLRLLNCSQRLCYTYKLKLHTSSSAVLYSSRDRDLPNPNLPTPTSKLHSQEPDILFEQLKKSRTIERCLELSEMHVDVMNSKHVVTCLEIIHDFLKGDKLIAQQLLDNHTFQSVCSRLMQVVRFLDPQEIITVYKVLAILGVRNNTFVMQSILKMVGAHLNDMTLAQLTFLNFLLNKQRPNSLVDGLKLALPLVLQVQIEQQLDSDNMTDVVNCLQLACRSRLKPATIEKVLAAVLQKSTVLSPNDAMTVIFSLLNLETPVDGYKELLSSCFDVISKNIVLLNKKQILAITRVCRNQGYYNSKFFFLVAEKVVNEQWNLESTYEIISHFYKLNFFPPNLMDHFVDVICSESELLVRTLEYSPLNCIEYLTATGYQPTDVDKAVHVLCSCKEKLSHLAEKSPNLLIKFLGCLSILGHFPRDLLSKILNEDYLFEAWSQSRKQGRVGDYERSVFSLIWGLEVYNQQENFFFPVAIYKKLTQAVCQRYFDFVCPLEKFIGNGLGGSQFLLSGVFTSDGHIIDHVLAMRSGNYPVSLNSLDSAKRPLNVGRNITFAEDIILPEDAKIVAVIVANEEQYCKDPEVLRGWMHLKIKSLAKKKFSPVVIHYSNWMNLPDREKIPYLMREIKQAVQEDDILKTTSLS